MRSTSSRIIPLDELSSSKILSSFLFKLALSYAIETTNSCLVNSTSGISMATTSPSSYSYKPSSVTVKFITVTRINICFNYFNQEHNKVNMQYSLLLALNGDWPISLKSII